MRERARWRGGWLDYVWAVVVVVIAIALRRFGDPRLGEQLPYGSVLLATIIIAWFGGVGPALVVVAVGGAAANFFLLPPRGSFAAGPPHQSWGLVVFLFLGTVIALCGGYLRRQRVRAETSTDQIRDAEAALREARDSLERRVDERTAELAHANESLRASEAQLRLLVEGVRSYAILMLTHDGTIDAWNGGARRLFGRSADVVGRPISVLIPDLHGDALPQVAEYSVAERVALRGDGSELPIELEITPLDGRGLTPAGGAAEGQRGSIDGNSDRYVAIVRDISERKRLEAINEQKQRRSDELRRKSEALAVENLRMQESARLQNEFLANMSHELRTPLNAIIGFSHLLHGGMVGPLEDQQREFLGDILTSSRHLLQLINDVLDLAKIEAGGMELSLEPVELGRVISEVRDIVRGMAVDRELAIDLDLPEDLGAAVVDPAKLRQILYNYISNALKFTPDGGRVTVRASQHGDRYRIEVEDTGIGIAEKDQRYLFVAFRQLDAGATKRYAGTGLGLALTKRLAEAHGGAVGVRSARGEGSTFWVELPRTARASAA